jgi:hypothetical protein
MVVGLKLSTLREGHAYEYVARFALGGVTTLVAGVVADIWGAETGGLMLAFPAIFCASATLIEKHERERKSRKGLPGNRRGKEAAALDAAGAAWGSVGLASFALACWGAAEIAPILCLGLASGTWLVTTLTLWRARRELRVAHPQST